MPRKNRKAKQAEEVYQVEVITKARVSPPDDFHDESYWEYFVKWEGYDSDGDSWEPEVNLHACQRLLTSFWEHIGMDSKDYYPGYELKASKEWIEGERAYFSSEFKKGNPKSVKDEKPKGKTIKNEKGKSASAPVSKKAGSRSKTKHSTSPETDSNDSSSEDEPMSKKPALQAAAPRLTIKINTKKRKQVITSSSEEEPLLANKNTRPNKIRKGDKDNDVNKEVIEIPSSPDNHHHSPNSLFSGDSSIERDIPAKMTKKPLPNIPRRNTNPQASIAAMSPSEIPQAGGITTKQRLAQGALQPTAPKNISGAEPYRPSQKQAKQNMANLKFTKKVPQNSSNSVFEESSQSQNILANEPTLASLNTPPIESPRSALASPSVGFSQPGQRLPQKRTSMSEATVAPSAVFGQPASMSVVDNFLGTMMPPEMSAPMNFTPELPSMEVSLPRPLHAKIPLPGRLQSKAWKWTGPLHVKSDEEPFCNVAIHNTTTDISLRFSIVFEKLDKIHMTNMYDFKEIQLILPVFRRPTQSALMSPADSPDIQRLGVLAHYMREKSKVFMIPIRLDNNTIGQILCIPSSLRFIFNVEPPPEMDGNSTYILMAILPYKLDPVDIDTNSHIHPAACSLLPHFDFDTFNALEHPKMKKKEIRFYDALDMLRFPVKLYDYVSEPQKRTYAIWAGPEPDEQPPVKPRKPIERRLLEELVSRHAEVRRVNIQASARMIFIHVGALKVAYELPDFVERRVNQQFTQFYHYGSDPSIHPSLWKTEEIWPCGGIVTFTPDALAKNPRAAQELMRKIDTHPLWLGYILPAVLGVAAYLECGKDSDALAAFDSRKLLLDPILEEIAEGTVAILEAPPDKPTVLASKDIHAEWLEQYIAVLPPSKREALQKGVKGLEEFRALKTQAKSIDLAIAEDLTRMEMHPAFMYNYRRYVVVCGPDDMKVNTTFRGFEWPMIEKFDFKDDFFVKQEVGA